MVIVLNFCFKELRYGLHADSVVLVDFLHVLRSIEGDLFLCQMLSNKRLVSFAAITGFINPSQHVLHLGVFGVK